MMREQQHYQWYTCARVLGYVYSSTYGTRVYVHVYMHQGCIELCSSPLWLAGYTFCTNTRLVLCSTGYLYFAWVGLAHPHMDYHPRLICGGLTAGKFDHSMYSRGVGVTFVHWEVRSRARGRLLSTYSRYDVRLWDQNGHSSIIWLILCKVEKR